MRPWAKRLLHLSALAVGGTGLLWGWMRYFWTPGEEPLDPLLLMEWSGTHPWEPWTRTLHLLWAPLSVFAVGVIWQSHVAPRLRKPWARRRTGLTLALVFAPMVLSGVLLQTAASDEARRIWVWVHGVTGTLWVLGYAAHMIAGAGGRQRRKSAELPPVESA